MGTLHEALKQTAILSDAEPEMVVDDPGYGDVKVNHVQIWRSGKSRGVTRGLKATIRRRCTIEPTIGHMNRNGKLDCNCFRGTLVNALNAVLCGAGHNVRLIFNKHRDCSAKDPAY